MKKRGFNHYRLYSFILFLILLTFVILTLYNIEKNKQTDIPGINKTNSELPTVDNQKPAVVVPTPTLSPSASPATPVNGGGSNGGGSGSSSPTPTPTATPSPSPSPTETPDIPLELTAPIAAKTYTANADQSVLILGENFDQNLEVMVYDGFTIESARILVDNNNNEIRNNQKIMFVVPQNMQSGTLKVWLQNSTNKISNEVLLNNPELWWVQPNKIDFDEQTRIFGRNLDSNDENNFNSNIEILISNSTNDFTILGTVLESNVISFNFDFTSGISYGDYLVHVKDLKFNQWYGGLNITLRPKNLIPSYTKSITEFGAIANDGISDSAALIAALADVSGAGGGTVSIPSGSFNLDHTTLISTGTNVHLKGQGVDQTILLADDGYNGINVGQDSIASDFTLKSTATYLNVNGVIHSTGTSGSIIRNIKVDYDSITNNAGAFIQYANCKNCLMENVEIYGIQRGIRTDGGSQLMFRNITNYGLLDIGRYENFPSGSWYAGASAFTSTGSAKEIIIEDCTAKSRWYENDTRGRFQRFFTSGPTAGGIYNYYFGNNKIIDIVGDPFSGYPETLMSEGKGMNYVGEAVVNESNPNLLHLTGKPGTRPENCPEFYDDQSYTNETLRIKEFSHCGVMVDSLNFYTWQGKVPFTVLIINGTGLGQIRKGLLETNPKKLAKQWETRIYLDEPFTINPDETSEIAIGFLYGENIIYGNEFSTANRELNGIHRYGKTHEYIIKNNKFRGYNAAIEDWYFSSLNDIGAGGTVNYFSEISDNDISDSNIGIRSVIGNTPDGLRAFQALGNVFRNNNIHDMNLDFPQQHDVTTPWFGGISISDERRVNNLNDKTSLYAQIYENNIVKGDRRGFKSNGIVAGDLILRNNDFSEITIDAFNLTQTPNYVNENNNINNLPHVIISDSTGNYLNEFLDTSSRLSNNNILYVYSKENSGSATLNIEDIDGDLISIVGISSVQGISINSNVISWSNLEKGLYKINVSVSDARDVLMKKLYLFVGNYEGFDNITYNSCGNSSCVLNIQTDDGNYITKTEKVIYANHYQDVDWQDWNALRWHPINEEAVFKSTQNTSETSQNAILSFQTQYLGSRNGSMLKVRLKQDDQTYYEVVDEIKPTLGSVINYYKTRELKKIVNNVNVLSTALCEIHRNPTVVIFEKQGNNIKVTYEGNTIEMNDPSPLEISDYEIVASILQTASINPGSDAANYRQIGHLFFEKGDNIQMSPLFSQQQEYTSEKKSFWQKILGFFGKVIDIFK